jgi:siroheme synthase-like protein
VIEHDLYVACIDLKDRPVLVVGAGEVALDKIQGLLTCKAAVTVVAPDVHEDVEALAELGALELRKRGYDPSDLDGALLVVAATSDTELNTRVHDDATNRSMLVNVVDVPDLCSFILPAIVREGPLAIAISTAGASPALAKRMKREAADAFGPEYAELAFLLDEVRDWAKKTLPTYDDRKVFFEAIVNGDPDPIAMLKEKRVIDVRELIGSAQRRAERALAAKP